MQAEQDRRFAQVTDELTTLKIALLEQAETNAAEAKRSENRDRLIVQTKQTDAEPGRLQAKLDELLLSHVQDVRAIDQARGELQQKVTSALPTGMPTPTRTTGVNMHANKLQNMKRNLCIRKFPEIRLEMIMPDRVRHAYHIRLI